MGVIARLPQTGEAGTILRGELAAKLVEHRLCIDRHGHDVPGIRKWKWEEPAD